jgi:hypothetical protein
MQWNFLNNEKLQSKKQKMLDILSAYGSKKPVIKSVMKGGEECLDQIET